MAHRTRSITLAVTRLAIVGTWLALILGCGDKPNDMRPAEPGPKSRPTNRGKEKEPEPAEQVIRISADDLDDEFEENEAAANAKYKGKVVEVSGRVHKVDRSHRSKVVVELHIGDEDDTLDCEFPARDPSLAAVKAGQDVVIRGTCLGIVDDTVTLGRCSIVK